MNNNESGTSLLSALMQGRGRRIAILIAAFAFLVAFGSKSGAFEAAWEEIVGHRLPAAGKPVPATHSKLSEHNIEWVRQQPPQLQAEFLLGAAINHDEGATDLITKLLDDWRGHLTRTEKWQNLEETALYSNDLRVRAAAIEINLVVNNLAKSGEIADRLMTSADASPGSRPWNAWELGMLANRGVETERVHQWLATYANDPEEQTRFWAVEGLAHLGTDESITDFLEVLRNDPSLKVRERAGCSLAKSGMLTRWQRMKAVPGLLDLTDDSTLDPTARNWVYQALREITDVSLPNQPVAWRDWYTAKGAEATEASKTESWRVLGNN
jgi:hypothetical protein